MLTLKINYENGDYTHTRMNTTPEEAKAYYIGKTFNIGIVSDNLQKCTSVEILEDDSKPGIDSMCKDCSCLHNDCAGKKHRNHNGKIRILGTLEPLRGVRSVPVLLSIKQKGGRRMKNLAEKLYDIAADMDVADYEETRDEEISALVQDLEKLPADGALMKCLEIIVNQL